MKIKFEVSLAHFAKDCRPSHGPQQWPWWRLVSFALVTLFAQSRIATGRRLWFYTRWGAGYIDIYLIRRISA